MSTRRNTGGDLAEISSEQNRHAAKRLALGPIWQALQNVLQTPADCFERSAWSIRRLVPNEQGSFPEKLCRAAVCSNVRSGAFQRQRYWQTEAGVNSTTSKQEQSCNARHCDDEYNKPFGSDMVNQFLE